MSESQDENDRQDESGSSAQVSFELLKVTYGKRVASSPGGPMLRSEGHGFTTRSSGVPDELVTMCKPDALLSGLVSEISPYASDEETQRRGALAVFEDSVQPFIIISRIRHRPELGEGKPGRPFTLASSWLIHENDWRYAAYGALKAIEATPDVATDGPKLLQPDKEDATTIPLASNDTTQEPSVADTGPLFPFLLAAMRYKNTSKPLPTMVLPTSKFNDDDFARAVAAYARVSHDISGLPKCNAIIGPASRLNTKRYDLQIVEDVTELPTLPFEFTTEGDERPLREALPEIQKLLRVRSKERPSDDSNMTRLMKLGYAVTGNLSPHSARILASEKKRAIRQDLKDSFDLIQKWPKERWKDHFENEFEKDFIEINQQAIVTLVAFYYNDWKFSRLIAKNDRPVKMLNSLHLLGWLFRIPWYDNYNNPYIIDSKNKELDFTLRLACCFCFNADSMLLSNAKTSTIFRDIKRFGGIDQRLGKAMKLASRKQIRNTVILLLALSRSRDRETLEISEPLRKSLSLPSLDKAPDETKAYFIEQVQVIRENNNNRKLQVLDEALRDTVKPLI